MNLKNITFLAVLSLIFGCQQNNKIDKSETDNSPKLQLDSITKAELDADDYGMKTYVIAFLKSGQNDSLPQAESEELLRAHLKNIEKLAEDNTLV